MKNCPICHARCFDDMDLCYGCLHRFSDDISTGENNSCEKDTTDDCPANESSTKEETTAGSFLDVQENESPQAPAQPKLVVQSDSEDTVCPNLIIHIEIPRLCPKEALIDQG